MDLQKIINEKESRILELKHYLRDTDYHILKQQEGYTIDDSILQQRAYARIEINQTEVEIELIKEQTEQELEELVVKIEENEDI